MRVLVDLLAVLRTKQSGDLARNLRQMVTGHTCRGTDWRSKINRRSPA